MNRPCLQAGYDAERFSGIECSSHEGECSGSDDPVSGGAWRRELDAGGAEDDGRSEAGDGEVQGVGAEKAVPGEKEAGAEPTNLPYEDGEGHSEADTPGEHAPVNYAHLTGPQREGHTVESSCPKWRQKPTMTLVPRPEDGHMVSMVVRQVTGTGL